MTCQGRNGNAFPCVYILEQHEILALLHTNPVGRTWIRLATLTTSSWKFGYANATSTADAQVSRAPEPRNPNAASSVSSSKNNLVLGGPAKDI